MIELQEIAQHLQQGNASTVKSLTQRLLDNGVSPQTILNEGLIAGMAVVGEQMRCGEMYLPEVLQSASVMNAAMDILKPHLLRGGVQPVGRVVLGTVKGDMHDIGKNLVGIMLQGAGFEIIDLGINTPPEKFVEAIQIHHPQIVGMSAMLTTTMLVMKTTIDVINTAGARSQVKIIVGGAPVTQRFADEIGADGFAKDAVTAVDKVKELLA
ncbi:MAG: corrinoid protein [candidate division KSB1 bacterium]|nr:corrinoid protein [candidate division KSB1 bacterium]MDZ7300922.1 corrinoid protein [candidate division KSB1 bacterium]MDZ7314073.1 corrinoid protein [candidate division KSB1 bacterium]